MKNAPTPPGPLEQARLRALAEIHGEFSTRPDGRMVVQLSEGDLGALVRREVEAALAAREATAPVRAAEPTPTAKWYTVQEAAEKLRLSAPQVRKLVSIGRLRSKRPGDRRRGKILIPASEVDALTR